MVAELLQLNLLVTINNRSSLKLNVRFTKEGSCKLPSPPKLGMTPFKQLRIGYKSDRIFHTRYYVVQVRVRLLWLLLIIRTRATYFQSLKQYLLDLIHVHEAILVHVWKHYSVRTHYLPLLEF